jgi:hypothetical protein
MSEISALTTANMLAQLSLPLIQAAVIPPDQGQLLSNLSTSIDTVTISTKAAVLQTPHK